MSTSISTKGPREAQTLFRPLSALREEFDQLLNRISSGVNVDWLKSEFTAACDLSETAEAFQVRMDVPGIKPDDITVQVTGDTVQISGERKEEKEEKGKTYHRLERRSGKFSETMRLPCAVNEEKVQAEFHDGVLTVTLPKTESTRTRTVKVKAHETK